MTDEHSLLTAELMAVIGRETDRRSFTIQPLIACRLAEALGLDPNAVAQAPTAPPYYIAAFESQSDVLELPPELGNGVLSGDDWELLRPLRWGERIHSQGRVAEIYERFGQHGQTLFIRHEWTFSDDTGGIVAIGRRTLARFFPHLESERGRP